MTYWIYQEKSNRSANITDKIFNMGMIAILAMLYIMGVV